VAIACAAGSGKPEGSLRNAQAILDDSTPHKVAPTIQILNWVSGPQVEFHTHAAAGILVLVPLLVPRFAAAISRRDRYQKRGLS
jgi:hypothetical protein